MEVLYICLQHRTLISHASQNHFTMLALYTADLPDTTPFLKFRFFKTLDPFAKTSTTKPSSTAAWALFFLNGTEKELREQKLKNQSVWEI